MVCRKIYSNIIEINWSSQHPPFNNFRESDMDSLRFSNFYSELHRVSFSRVFTWIYVDIYGRISVDLCSQNFVLEIIRYLSYMTKLHVLTDILWLWLGDSLLAASSSYKSMWLWVAQNTLVTEWDYYFPCCFLSTLHRFKYHFVILLSSSILTLSQVFEKSNSKDEYLRFASRILISLKD